MGPWCHIPAGVNLRGMLLISRDVGEGEQVCRLLQLLLVTLHLLSQKCWRVCHVLGSE